MCVPDTNALLHYTRFDLLPWAERMQVGLVRLVIPIAVVDELDAKKYARREEFQQRARELLALIDRHVTAAPPDGYSRMSQGVTVEVLPDEAGHLRVAATIRRSLTAANCSAGDRESSTVDHRATPACVPVRTPAASTSSSCPTATSCRGTGHTGRTPSAQREPRAQPASWLSNCQNQTTPHSRLVARIESGFLRAYDRS